jgi:hypothetical protein
MHGGKPLIGLIHQNVTPHYSVERALELNFGGIAVKE